MPNYETGVHLESLLHGDMIVAGEGETFTARIIYPWAKFGELAPDERGGDGRVKGLYIRHECNYCSECWRMDHGPWPMKI